MDVVIIHFHHSLSLTTVLSPVFIHHHGLILSNTTTHWDKMKARKPPLLENGGRLLDMSCSLVDGSNPDQGVRGRVKAPQKCSHLGRLRTVSADEFLEPLFFSVHELQHQVHPLDFGQHHGWSHQWFE